MQPTPPARAVLQAHAAFLAGPFSASYPELHTVVQQDALFPFLLASKAKFKSSRGVWEAVKESGGFQTGWVKGCVEVWDQANLLDKARSDDQNEDSENVEKISEANIGVVSQIVGKSLSSLCGEVRSERRPFMLANILASDDQAHDIERLLSKLQDSMSHARVLAYLVCRGLLIRSSVDEQISLAARILDVMGLRALDGADDDLNESALEEVHFSLWISMSVSDLIHLGVKRAATYCPSDCQNDRAKHYLCFTSFHSGSYLRARGPSGVLP